VTLKVYDVLGREVSTLINNEQNSGSHEVIFDGSKLSSGIYFFRLQTGNYTATNKMILMK
ncbi:MAG: T9SS type A sorting domain-containing protein, partial [Ignavibacteriaceae bacterium]|nr:T9SS type A sorting domain-containing protein [Ignavibacteriaceae bacterium]